MLVSYFCAQRKDGNCLRQFIMHLRVGCKTGRKGIVVFTPVWSVPLSFYHGFIPMPRPTYPSRLSRVSPANSGHGGFTLVELLTVMAILAILMAVLVPSLAVVQRSARKAKSTSNLHNIGGAMGAYSNDNDGLLPAPQFGPSTSPSNTVGSSNPRGATWLEELAYPYLEGQIQASSDGSKVIVTKWPDVLTDPEYLVQHDNVIPDADADKRGYGMNVYPYLADRSGKNQQKQTADYRDTRQKLGLLPNLANNVAVGTSDGVTLEPGQDGTFQKDGDEYSKGNPVRYGEVGIYLFMDWSVQALSPTDIAKILSSSSVNP